MAEPRFSPGTFYRGVILAFGLVVAGLIFRELVTLVLAVLIVVIIALPLSAIASRLERYRIPRALGVLIALLLALGAVAGLVVAIVPVISEEITRFTNSLPTIVDELRHRLAGLTGTSPSHAGQQVQSFVNGYTQHPTKLLGPLASAGVSVVTAIAALIVVLITAVFTSIRPTPLADGFVRMFPPTRRSHVETILSRLRLAYIGWLKGLAIGMLVLGGLTYVGLRIVGVSFAAFFAVFTALAMIVPYFGALVSSIPPIVYALTISPGKAVVVAIIYFVAHQLESNVIQPLVVARTVQLHPAVVAVGVVAVDQLFGFVGLFVAIPILVTIKILIEELWVLPMERGGRGHPLEHVGLVGRETTRALTYRPGGARREQSV